MHGQCGHSSSPRALVRVYGSPMEGSKILADEDGRPSSALVSTGRFLRGALPSVTNGVVLEMNHNYSLPTAGASQRGR